MTVLIPVIYSILPTSFPRQTIPNILEEFFSLYYSIDQYGTQHLPHPPPIEKCFE